MTDQPVVVSDGVSYYLWNDGYSVGYKAVNEAGEVEYTYLNASSGSDDGVATVFLYQGPAGEAGNDDALSHVTVHDDRPLNDEARINRYADSADPQGYPWRLVGTDDTTVDVSTRPAPSAGCRSRTG